MNGQRCQSNVNHYHFMSSVWQRYTPYIYMPSHQENLKQSNQFGNDLMMFVCEPRVISHHSLATEMTHGWSPLLTQSINCPRHSAEDLTIVDSLNIYILYIYIYISKTPLPWYELGKCPEAIFNGKVSFGSFCCPLPATMCLPLLPATWLKGTAQLPWHGPKSPAV